MKSRRTPRSTDPVEGCDFCLWIVYFAVPGVNDEIIAGDKIGTVAMELTCTFNAHDKVKVKKCSSMVKKAKQVFLSKARMYGEDPHEYVNTPSCDENQLPFGER